MNEMNATRRSLRTLLASAVLLATTTALVACGSAGTGESVATTTQSTTASQGTTGPEPITAQEQEWVGGLKKLQKGLERIAFEGGVVTRRHLLSEARVYDRCTKSLGAEPSARFHTAYEIASDACLRFHRAALQLRKAAANVDASGAVEGGTPQERNFNRAFERGNAFAGNAVNRMSAAVASADAVQESLPS